MREQSLSRFCLQKLITGIGHLSLLFLILGVVIQFGIVLARYVFGLNFLWLQEAVGYLHALTILLAFAWTLTVDKHVRIDVVSERWSTAVHHDGQALPSPRGGLFVDTHHAVGLCMGR